MQIKAPSKQFIKRASATTLVVLLLLGTQTEWFKDRFNKKTPNIVVSNQTVKELLDKDSNDNGISDWEEKLWGLDPKVSFTGGISNKDIIENKKKSLNIPNSFQGSTPINNTDKLAREIFALASTLGQSEAADSETLKEIGKKMSESVNASVSIVYTLKDIKTVPTSKESLEKYKKDLIVAIGDFDRNSPDIGVVIDGVESGDFSKTVELAKSATMYKTYSKKLLAVSVPVGIASDHLALLNSFNGFSEAFSYLSKMQDDAMSGVIGVAIYKAYNEKIAIAIANLEDYLTKYGII